MFFKYIFCNWYILLILWAGFTYLIYLFLRDSKAKLINKGNESKNE